MKEDEMAEAWNELEAAERDDPFVEFLETVDAANIVVQLDGAVREEGTRRLRSALVEELAQVDKFIAVCEERNWKFDSPEAVAALGLVGFSVRRP
jgi:hypothetical protein